jgi:hypothetical protein
MRHHRFTRAAHGRYLRALSTAVVVAASLAAVAASPQATETDERDTIEQYIYRDLVTDLATGELSTMVYAKCPRATETSWIELEFTATIRQSTPAGDVEATVHRPLAPCVPGTAHWEEVRVMPSGGTFMPELDSLAFEPDVEVIARSCRRSADDDPVIEEDPALDDDGCLTIGYGGSNWDIVLYSTGP